MRGWVAGIALILIWVFSDCAIQPPRLDSAAGRSPSGSESGISAVTQTGQGDGINESQCVHSHQIKNAIRMVPPFQQPPFGGDYTSEAQRDQYQYYVYILNSNVCGNILAISRVDPKDPNYYKLEISFSDPVAIADLNCKNNPNCEPNGRLWLYYRADRRNQALELYTDDQRGNTQTNWRPTQDAANAFHWGTKKVGVTAWTLNMDPTHDFEPPKLDAAVLRGAAPADVGVPEVAQGLEMESGLWSADCEDFIDDQGNYGQWGQQLITLFNKYPEAYSFIGQIGDLNEVCPNYSSFSKAQRFHFAVYLLAAMAMEESSCNPKSRARGPNGIAAGLLQLHLGATQRYCDQACGDNTINVFDPTANALCGAKMLNWYTGITLKNTSHEVYWNGNYWQTLHSNNSAHTRTVNLVKQYRPCWSAPGS